MRRALNGRCAALFIAAGFCVASGCAPSPTDRVNHVVAERTGHPVKWRDRGADDAAVSEAMRAVLSRELSAEGAVEIALLNNPGLQVRFEDLGIAQADLVQAGLLRNPVFAASWRFPDSGPRQTDAEYSVTAEFLDLLMIPLRKELAEQSLSRTEEAITHDVLALAADVKVAFYQVQARQAAIEKLGTLVEVEEASVVLAEAQHDAGTLSDLSLAQRQAAQAEVRRDLLAGRAQLVSEREKVNRLLGLWGAEAVWKAEGAMAELPAEEVPLEHLETVALSRRLDYAAARQSVETMGRAMGVSEDFRYLTTVTIGIDTEREQSGTFLTGPTLELELPIFDNGDARLAAMRGRYQQSRQELIRKAIDIRSETREARDRLMVERELVLLHTKTLGPLRTRILELTQLQTNAMTMGPYDLLAARRQEVMTERDTIEALRDYWIARAELERAVGGRLAAPAIPDMPSTGPASVPAEPAHEHSHGDMP